MTLKEQILLFQHLETERLILRPVNLDDVNDMFEYMSDPEVAHFVTFDVHKDVEECRDSVLGYFMANPTGKWAIEDKHLHKMIGTIDMRIDESTKSAEIGYVLNRSFWGQGIMPEAARELLQVGFDELGLNRIFATYNAKNTKSGRVMQKIGMQKEGVLRQGAVIKGELIDKVYYSILKSEYHSN
ncbi:GNAT family N-acetyltransferase [Pediococcus argentinicus]|uniref:Acetyltransferase, GNAT family protein n=1 Tax=Pediococcus argentinicus TaxID=480391 RepID=A0A0R2NGG1_9LACO|nr:GNAT family protein [Pediococcus argentinicus]KRO23675.1 acetyltransferase, GNAT family protein [Pediococcus argentinicus]NKZ22850.1 GNAT family N-acetyltransferase [Pediococcus argentinicus]GEP19927.1 N-acetyltransferase [Pediococcus argentinicus]